MTGPKISLKRHDDRLEEMETCDEAGPRQAYIASDVAAIVDSGTDAVIVSGTQNITKDNVALLVDMFKEYRIPKVFEPAGMNALRDDLDFTFVPSVVNTDEVFWLMGAHKSWVQHFPIDWEKVVPEAYIVLNPKSAVARVTKSRTELSPADAAACAVWRIASSISLSCIWSTAARMATLNWSGP